MPVKCQQIISWIEELAPKDLAEEWDNVGLQLGSPTAGAAKVLVTLDINEQVVEEAISLGVKFIICHHPLIFQPLKNLRSDLPQGKVISKLIGAGINVYAAHTNWDCAQAGVSRILADRLGLINGEVLKVTKAEKLFKIVVFVPRGHEDKVRAGLSKGGAGFIGNYSNCTFQVDGTGTFKPEDGTNPYIGEQGQLEKVAEYRLETIVPEKKLRSAINAMIKAHPYEEVAYDVIPLENQGALFGLGILGQLLSESTLAELVEKTKNVLGQKTVKAVGSMDMQVKKVAVCGGSGGDLINIAQFKGADVLITGDVGYHQAQSAEAVGLAIIDAGHYATEAISMETLLQYLQGKAIAEKKDGEVKFILSKINTEPWQYI